MSIKENVKTQIENASKTDSSFFENMMYEDVNRNAFCDLEVEAVQQHGGEGEGDDYYTVYKFSNGKDTVYAKFHGWYASYHGAEFTEWYFVEPKEVMKTVYYRSKV